MAHAFLSLLLLGCTSDPEPRDRPPEDVGDSDVPTVDTRDTATSSESDGSCRITPVFDWIAEPEGAPLSDGDTVTLVHGPQGGWHVGVTAGLQGAHALQIQPFVTLVATGQQVAGTDNAYVMPLWDFDPSTCSGRMQGMIAYLDDVPGSDQAFICSLAGQELVLRVLATDPVTGASGEASVQVRAAADPADTCP